VLLLVVLVRLFKAETHFKAHLLVVSWAPLVVV
jgi:hypothetical protein